MRRIARFFLFSLVVLGLTSCTNTLAITSEPANARVRINGADYGTTPLTLPRLERGRYEVVVQADHFEPWQSEIEVVTNQEVHAVLMPSSPPVERTVRVVERIVPETRLAVFVEPSGAGVSVDGRERGTAERDQPVLVTFDHAPATAEIVVEKPGFDRWTHEVTLETQRENRVFVKLNPLPVWHTYTSDAELMRQAVQQVVAATRNLPTLARDGSIAVLSIDNGEGSDEPMMTVVEDAMISTLSQAGFSPSERDDQLLIQLAHTTSGDSLPYRVTTGHANENYPFIYDAELATEQTRTEYHPVTVRSTTTTRVESGNRCDPEVTMTTTTTESSSVAAVERVTGRITGYIPTADQLLAYRILEIGISKTPITEGEPRPEPMLHRLAELRVHLRVIDAKRGVVTWAGYLTGRLADEIPARVSLDLANPPNRFAAEPLPDAWQRLRHAPARHVNATGAGTSALVEPRLR